jgi:hypothetical protein
MVMAADTSDVVRDLIRGQQEQDQIKMLERFRSLDTDGSNREEPTETVLKIVKKPKRARRALAAKS